MRVIWSRRKKWEWG